MQIKSSTLIIQYNPNLILILTVPALNGDDISSPFLAEINHTIQRECRGLLLIVFDYADVLISKDVILAHLVSLIEVRSLFWETARLLRRWGVFMCELRIP